MYNTVLANRKSGIIKLTIPRRMVRGRQRIAVSLLIYEDYGKKCGGWVDGMDARIKHPSVRFSSQYPADLHHHPSMFS